MIIGDSFPIVGDRLGIRASLAFLSQLLNGFAVYTHIRCYPSLCVGNGCLCTFAIVRPHQQLFRALCGLLIRNSVTVAVSSFTLAITGPVMILPMQGGAIDNSNSSSYGDGTPGGGFGYLPSGLDLVGLYEFNHISSTTNQGNP